MNFLNGAPSLRLRLPVRSAVVFVVFRPPNRTSDRKLVSFTAARTFCTASHLRQPPSPAGIPLLLSILSARRSASLLSFLAPRPRGRALTLSSFPLLFPLAFPHVATPQEASQVGLIILPCDRLWSSMTAVALADLRRSSLALHSGSIEDPKADQPRSPSRGETSSPCPLESAG